MTIHKFAHYNNKETGSIAYKIALVRFIDGAYYVCLETDYGFGAGVTQKKVTKGYKSEKAANNGLEKWVSALPNSASYERMASSHWKS